VPLSLILGRRHGIPLGFRREVGIHFALFCFPGWTAFVHVGVGGFDIARIWVEIEICP
jgi:hypothetical protein